MTNNLFKNVLKALGGGLAGAAAVTLLHETLRRIHPDAPRMDLLGMQALGKGLKSVGKQPPEKDKLFWWTIAGDILSNSLYYSLAGLGGKKSSLLKGTLSGLTAGLGAVVLPEPLGLNKAPSNRTISTKLMTVALYTIGGIVMAVVMKQLQKEEDTF